MKPKNFPQRKNQRRALVAERIQSYPEVMQKRNPVPTVLPDQSGVRTKKRGGRPLPGVVRPLATPENRPPQSQRNQS